MTDQKPPLGATIDSFDDLLGVDDLLPVVRVTVTQAWAGENGKAREFAFRLGVLSRTEVMDSDMSVDVPTAPSAGALASVLEKRRYTADVMRYEDHLKGARLVNALLKVGFKGLPSGTAVQQYEALKAKMPSALVTRLLEANEEIIKGKQSRISEDLFPRQRVLAASSTGDAALGDDPGTVERALAS